MVTSPIALVFLLLTVAVLVYTVISEVRKSRRGAAQPAAEAKG